MSKISYKEMIGALENILDYLEENFGDRDDEFIDLEELVERLIIKFQNEEKSC